MQPFSPLLLSTHLRVWVREVRDALLLLLQLAGLAAVLAVEGDEVGLRGLCCRLTTQQELQALQGDGGILGEWGERVCVGGGGEGATEKKVG